jgi:hypothetical protein
MATARKDIDSNHLEIREGIELEMRGDRDADMEKQGIAGQSGCGGEFCLAEDCVGNYNIGPNPDIFN